MLDLLEIYALGGLAVLALMVALGAGTLLNFDQLFIQFHLLGFSNELWQLDPARNYLIRLFPRGFWYDVFLLCGVITAGLAVVLGGMAGGYLLRAGGKPAS